MMTASAFIRILAFGLVLLTVAAPGVETARDLFQNARTLIEKEKPAAALPLLQRAADLAPDDAAVRHYLGYALWRIGQADAAEIELKRALKLAPDHTETLYILGRIAASRAAALIETQKPAEAVPLLQRAVILAPNEAGIHHYLGYALWSTGKPDEAAVAFTKALELAPGNAYTMYFLGRIAASRGQSERAIELYEAMLASGEPIYDTYQQVGKAYLRMGETQQALEATQRALRQKPLDGGLHYQMGRIYLQMNRRSAAQDEFDTAKRLKAADQEAIRKLLALDLAVEDKKEAEVRRLRNELLADSSRDAEILLQLGSMLGKGGFHKEAVQPLQLAVAMAPNAFDGRSNLGLALLRLGRGEEAEKHLKKALALRPYSFEVNSSLAFLHVNQGRNREAIERLRAANDARPNNIRVLTLLGQQYLQGRYLEEAIETLLIAKRVKPDSPKVLYFLVDAHQQNEQFPKALEVAREIREMNPLDARAHLAVGRQMANLGQCRQARPSLEQAIRLNPALPAAWDTLGDCHAGEGRYQAALAAYERARQAAPGDLRASRGIAKSLIQLERYPEALTELERSVQTRHAEDAQLYSDLFQVHTKMGNPAQAAQARTRSEKLRVRELELTRKRTFQPVEPPASGPITPHPNTLASSTPD